VRLHVRVCGTKEGLCAAEREGLGDVDELAATVVAATGVALGVLVGENGTLRFKDGAGNEVLARDHLECAALAAEFAVEDRSDLRVDLGERGSEGRRHGRSL
jgi:hypothetical protein